MMMTDRMDDLSLTARVSHDKELPVGAGASIVIAVATSMVLALTLLFATLAPAHAEGLSRLGTDGISSSASSQSLSMIVVTAVLAVWLTVSADLWRALFNRVKSWERSRS